MVYNNVAIFVRSTIVLFRMQDIIAKYGSLPAKCGVCVYCMGYSLAHTIYCYIQIMIKCGHAIEYTL